MSTLHSKRRSFRRGMTLLEVVMTIFVGATVVGVATGAVIHMLQVNSAGHQHRMALNSWFRLAEQWRADVHAADDVAQEEPRVDAPVVLTLPGKKTIEYQIVDGLVQRMSKQEEEATGQEVYEIAGSRVVGFEIDREAASTNLAIVIEQEVTLANGAPQPQPTREPIRLEAVLGRDGRFAAPAK